MANLKLAVMISGRGSNLQSLIDACAPEDFPAEIVLVISNRPKAGGLDLAKAANIPTVVINHREFGTQENNYEDGRSEFDDAVNEALAASEAKYVCLAGFMRLLTPEFVQKWRGRLINIHPSLLPAFKGLNVHERMIDAGVKLAGCSVHFVVSDMDAGPIIGQAAVPVLSSDTAETLAERILQEEHKLYPACIKLLANGKARLATGGIVSLDSDATELGTLRNPSE